MTLHTNCWAALSLPQYSRHVHENSKSRGVLRLALSLVRPGAKKHSAPYSAHGSDFHRNWETAN